MDEQAVPISYVGELRRALADLPDDHPMFFQVVAADGSAWNMFCQVAPKALTWAALLQLKHADLQRLPSEAFSHSASGDEGKR